MPMAETDPGAEAWYQRGLAHLDAGRLEEAEGCFRGALERDPRHAKAQVNLGVVLQRGGRSTEAEQHYRAAVEAAPALAQAWFNLGTVQLDRDEFAAALEPLDKAVRLDPSVAEWHTALATAQQAAGRPLEAIASLQQATQLDPRSALSAEQLGICLLESGDASAALAAFDRARGLDPEGRLGASNRLFALNFLPDWGPERISQAHRTWARELGISRMPSARREPRSGERVRIGYLSPDLRSHSVAWFLQPVLAHHDPRRFEVVCYSDAASEDEVSARLRSRGHSWQATGRLSNEELADLIQRDGIDILVDLAGHSSGGKRMPMLARKPAPIQASWLGYLNTTGLDSMDYRITDALACPQGMERFHTEQLIRLPHCQWCFQPLFDAPAPPVAPPPVEQAGGVTFGSFHNLAKLTPRVLEAWARLLRETPGSRLLIVARGAPQLAQSLRAKFGAAGVDPLRIDCEGHVPIGEYLALHGRVDINLDAFPYAGGTTTLHSLWMGVPVVTLAGESAVSRGGASILGVLGLDELVAASEDDYVRIARALAQDRKRLKGWRASLRERLERSPLMDAQRFTRDLETALLEMWTRHAARERDALRLHVGGRLPMPGWQILNVQPGPDVDYVGDCRHLGQFADGTVQEIYASHVLEHLGFRTDLPQALAEFHRVLAPGGNARISVPDFEILCRLFIDPKTSKEERFHLMMAALGGQLDEHDFHHVGLTYEFLRNYLLEAGFSKVERTGDFGLFQDDSRTIICGVPISLNVIAYK
jgi:protein O-GlcNAc transferase